MKFLNDSDAKLFLIELGNFEAAKDAKKDYVPTNEELQSFIKKRDGLIGGLKDHRKSQDAKANWRENRHKMMKGIKSYHRSTEGKRFHRNLGNFLATRLSRKRTNESIDIYETVKAITSTKTHMYIELQYYHPVFEQAEVELMVMDYAIPMLTAIEAKVLQGASELTEDESAFLMDITEEEELKKVFSESDGELESIRNSLGLT